MTIAKIPQIDPNLRNLEGRGIKGYGIRHKVFFGSEAPEHLAFNGMIWLREVQRQS